MARILQFEVGEYYHVFNRGVDKRKIFMDKGDLFYFLDNLIILNRHEHIISNVYKNARKREKQNVKSCEPLVIIVAYALLPNHFHLVLKEITPGGVSKFMHKLSTSYSKFFNEKYDRSGSLFQGTFKATNAIDLVSMTAYVNLNYVHHKYDTKKDLVRTSYFEYVEPSTSKESICVREEVQNILKMSGGVKDYVADAGDWSAVFVESHSSDKTFNT